VPLLEWIEPGVVLEKAGPEVQKKLDFGEAKEKGLEAYALRSGTPPPPPSAREQKRPKKIGTAKKEKNSSAAAGSEEHRQEQ
jgi:hypothetical protein